MSGTDPPLIAGKIHGLRVWNVSWKDGMLALTGQAQQVPWRASGATRARCQSHRGHRAPREGCGCGLYALHPSASSAQRTFSATAPAHGLQEVGGIVEAWGAVEVHEEGFRAEYARPFALVLPRKLAGTDVGALIEQLGARYGCQVLELDGERSLQAFCEGHDLGLSPPVVTELLEPKLKAGKPTFGPAPAPASRPTTGFWDKAGTVVGYVLGGLWCLFWFAVVVVIGYSFFAGVLQVDDEPAHRISKDHRRLELVDQSLIELDSGDSLYIAVVKNRSRVKTALGVVPRGSFLGKGGTYLGSPEGRADVDSSPNLAPGQTGVIFDYVVPAAPGQVRDFEIRLRGRRFLERAKRSPVTIESTRLDRRRCLITTRIRSSRPMPEAGVAVVLEDRRGKIVAGTWELVGPLPRGVSTQVVDRVPPRPCRTFVGKIAAYPNLTARQLGVRKRKPAVSGGSSQ